MCLNPSCGNAVDDGSIEIAGEGFVCSSECEEELYEDVYYDMTDVMVFGCM